MSIKCLTGWNMIVQKFSCSHFCLCSLNIRETLSLAMEQKRNILLSTVIIKKTFFHFISLEHISSKNNTYIIFLAVGRCLSILFNIICMHIICILNVSVCVNEFIFSSDRVSLSISRIYKH